MVEAPLVPPLVGEGFLEQLAGLGDPEKVLLIGRLLVRVRRRDHHRVHAEIVVEEVEDVANRLRRVGVEERRVRRHPKAPCLRLTDRRHSRVEDARPVDCRVVPIAQAVQVHDPGEIVRRAEAVEAPAQEHGVGAQVDVDLAAYERPDHALDVGMEQWLAAGDGHHGRAALRYGLEHVLHRKALAQDFGRMLDLPAAGARQVAREERLDLDDEGVVLGLLQAVPNQVGTDTDVLTERDRHHRT